MKHKSNIVLLIVLLIVALAVVVGARTHVVTAVEIEAVQDRPDLNRLLDMAEDQGRVMIIVGFELPGYDPARMAADAQAEAEQTAAIAQAQAALLDRLSGLDVTSIKTFDYIPFMALTIDAAGLKALAADPLVSSIEEDVPVSPDLAQSVPLIKADYVHIVGYSGEGQTVAVLDTGVAKTHPALSGKVVSEACYSTNNAGQGASSLCPGGATSSTASGSGVNCATTTTGCDHGTHVAGIVSGVAPNANLIAIQVFSRFTNTPGNTSCTGTSPCTKAFTSDVIAGLNRVYALRTTYSIASVNMSLGGGQYTATCDSTEAARKAAIDLLRSANIASVIAAGNSDYRNAMAAPACISTAISVGATTKTDQVASYSNLASFTTLLAPGSDIYAPVPGNNYDSKNGTSMAAPHVAGAVAILKQAKPAATVSEIITQLTTTGTFVTDQRSGGSVTKRRLDVWQAMCGFITCDIDDFRVIQLNQTLTGNINPATDIDNYYFPGQAGNKLTIQMNRTSGSVDPYLELIDPDGDRVSTNNNGGGGVNALINGYTLQDTGLYRIHGKGVAGTGGYQLSASSQSVALNPVPVITRLSPNSATATSIGADFWVAIHGSNFMPTSEVRWNSSLRIMAYSSSQLIYIRVLGSDINFPAPRTAFITVKNPAPGGGTSISMAFAITFPFLGESALIAPLPNTSLSAGVSTTFVISWTHPISSWRTMQNMDLRLRDDAGNTAMWLRLTEANPTSTLSLLNSAETPIISTTLVSNQFGQGGDLIVPDGVTLHTTETKFFGSGQTIVFSPTVTFDPAVAGTYNIEFRVDNEQGEVQDDDVFGTLIIEPAGCATSLSSVMLSGTLTGTVNTPYLYTATIDPPNATLPITYTWSPEPDSGQGTSNATYTWLTPGESIVFVGVENCGTFVADLKVVNVRTTTLPDLSLSKTAPVVALPGEPITYTLTITNSGVDTANNVIITDVLPFGANYISGGTKNGSAVTWTIPSLTGFGAVTQTTLIVTATSTITNSNYAARASGGYSTTGSPTVTTRIVDAKVDVAPLVTGTLSYNNPGATTAVTVPMGSVFEETTIAYQELVSPTHPLPSGSRFAGRALRLDGYQANVFAPDLALGEAIPIVLTYTDGDVAGLDENLLGLSRWTGNAWSSNDITCQPEPSNNRSVCQAQTSSLGEFALVETQYRVYLPLIIRDFAPIGDFVQITNITLAGNAYQVNFTTYNYTPQLPGKHVHFFFNTVPPDQAGMPGSGPWYVYGGGSPFTGYGTADRPPAATQLCALVANPDHSIVLNTGNCTNLP
ncbi:MAG: S8 family serine peptidase [Chloroflexi bacterium]|nr:S8 family serine peptidase [Chloroflexota bacterium]